MSAAGAQSPAMPPLRNPKPLASGSRSAGDPAMSRRAALALDAGEGSLTAMTVIRHGPLLGM